MNEIITLDEALKDYAENERDIRMCQMALEGGWDLLHAPRQVLTECLEMREVIAKTILDLGGSVPESGTEALAERTALLEALQAAASALRSYQFGNGSLDLAQEVAVHIEEVIRKAKESKP